ncbi:MAG: tetratricopeptide repeat protein [bacterium]|nr:tetratricopeptide repeat protein [bacterium]
MIDMKFKLKGIEAFKEGSYKKAIKFFNKFLEESDKDETVLNYLAESYIKEAELSEAIVIYFKLARIQKSKGNFIDSRNTLKLLTGYKKNDPMVFSILGEVEAGLGNIPSSVENYIKSYNLYIEEGKTKSGLTVLQQAKELQPDNVELDLLIADCYKMDGYITHSLRAYISAIQKLCNKRDFPSAEKALSLMKNMGEEIPELFYGYGILLNAKGDYDGAISQFQRAIEILPTFFESLIGIGQALSNKGDYSKAMHYFKEAEKIEPGSPLLMESIGDIFSKKNLMYDALEKYLHAFEAYKDQNRYIEVFQLFGKILTIHSENLYVLENWGNILLGLGNIEEAVEKFSKCFNYYVKEELFENALEIGNKILQINPENEEVSKKVSQIESGIKPEFHEDPSQVAAEVKSEESPGYRSPEEEEKYNLIKSALDKQKFEEALMYVDSLIKSDPEYPEYYLTKAEILIGVDKFDESIKNYEKSAELFTINNDFKKSVFAYKQITNLLESMKPENQGTAEVQGTQGYDEKAIDLIEDYIKDGDQYLKDGKIKEAKEVYNKILNVYPNYLNAKEKLSELNLIETFERKAQAVIEEGDYYSNFNLGIAYKEMGLFDQAVEQFKLSLNDKDYSLPSFEAIAQTYEDLHQYESAIEWLKEGLKKPGYSSKDYLPLKFEMGRIYELMGNLSGAIKWYNEVFKQDFNFRNVGKKLAVLGQKIKGIANT